jgi:lipopolysaccharide heptosyltransferase I
MQILVVKLSSLGDLCHALPTVRALKHGLNADVDWATQTNYAAVVRCFTDVRRVIGFPRRGGVAERVRFARELRRARYDLILDLQGLLKSALVTRLARGVRRIGPSFHREGARLFYNAVAGVRDKQRHAVAEILDVVRHLQLPLPAQPEFPVVFPKQQIAAGHPRIALAPCSRWPTKNWPAARFGAAARALHAETGATFFLVGAPEDRPVCDEIAATLGPAAVNRCGETSLVELGGVLAEMDLALTVDSGPMHVAAALGVPVLALFGPTDPQRTGPFGARHRVLQAPAETCGPCFRDHCRHTQPLCMEYLQPDAVVAAALDMLGRQK